MALEFFIIVRKNEKIGYSYGDRQSNTAGNSINIIPYVNLNYLLTDIDKWLRRRICMYIWKKRKKIRIRYAMLRKLIFDHTNAIRYANTRKGYWHTAKSQILWFHNQ